jgi:RNase adapter protein RapZ
MNKHTERTILIITGLSGAGKSHALKSLEDSGFEAIDNLPLSLLRAVAGQGSDAAPARLAIGVDVRSRDFSAENLFWVIENWRSELHCRLELLFLDADDDVLQRRYTETRRRHPLALDRAVADGIALERELLQPLRKAADRVLNTSALTVHELKRYMQEHFSPFSSSFLVFLTSFSYREGLPRDADMVLDVRFLRNPHYEVHLREKTGLDHDVGAYIIQDTDFESFYANLTTLLSPLLPRYLQEGKSYFTLAVGCTGGKHRSVFVVEKLAGFLRNLGYKVGVRHRELSL